MHWSSDRVMRSLFFATQIHSYFMVKPNQSQELKGLLVFLIPKMLIL
jgi:hypothetical protein